MDALWKLIAFVLVSLSLGQRTEDSGTCNVLLSSSFIHQMYGNGFMYPNTTEIDIVFPGGTYVDCGNIIPGNVTAVQPISIKLNKTKNCDFLTITLFENNDTISNNVTYLQWLVANVQMKDLVKGNLGSPDIVKPYKQRMSNDPLDYDRTNILARRERVFQFYCQPDGKVDPKSYKGYGKRSEFVPVVFAQTNQLGYGRKGIKTGPYGVQYFLGFPTPNPALCKGADAVTSALLGCSDPVKNATDTAGNVAGTAQDTVGKVG